MEDQEAISVLKKMLEKDCLDTKEKEAVSRAIGLFSWALLSKSRIKTRKVKQEKSTNW